MLYILEPDSNKHSVLMDAIRLELHIAHFSYIICKTMRPSLWGLIPICRVYVCIVCLLSSYVTIPIGSCGELAKILIVECEY